MSIKKLTKEAISNVSGGAIIEPVEGFFFVVSDEDSGRKPTVLSDSFPTYKIACDQARVLGVTEVLIVPTNCPCFADRLALSIVRDNA